MWRPQDSAKAKEVLQCFAADHPEAMDLTCVNILAELHIGDEEWAEASRLIADAAAQLCADGGLPIDLQVRIVQLSVSGCCSIWVFEGLAPAAADPAGLEFQLWRCTDRAIKPFNVLVHQL